jgi:oxygen-dependent protoporphyrinogen oxidase
VAGAVVVAVPPPIAAGAVVGLDRRLSDELSGTLHASVVTVVLGYRVGEAGEVPAISGCQVPLAEGRQPRACTVVSNKWPGRALEGAALFRLSLGGGGRVSAIDLDDDEMIDIARAELGGMLGVAALPAVARGCRWRDAMPQYVLRHHARVAAIEGRLDDRWPGLAFAGGAWHGAGMADAIESGERAAGRVLATVAS